MKKFINIKLNGSIEKIREIKKQIKLILKKIEKDCCSNKKELNDC
jgi:hypothetical protein